jgi:light-regulated signal transduction histidine kinase (bacteriophytochrome)
MPAILERIGRGEAIDEFETRRQRKDGSLVPVVLCISPLLAEDGSVIGASAIVHDITDRKQAEENLRRTAEELKKSNSDLEQFASVASHDLQEPLRMVTGFVQLLHQQYSGRLDAEADKYIDFAVDGAKRMHTLINDLLAYARIGTRGRPPVTTRADEALRDALANLRSSIEETAAEITCGDLPVIQADEGQLAQLFQNLVGNAIKFRGQSPPKIRVEARQQDDGWLFSVGDNGIGIAPEFGERIFLIFQRLHSRREYPGTGIGLAICKRIVDRHGGRIWVESQAGRGSTFYFTLPN